MNNQISKFCDDNDDEYDDEEDEEDEEDDFRFNCNEDEVHGNFYNHNKICRNTNDENDDDSTDNVTNDKK